MKRSPDLELEQVREAVRVCACFNLRRVSRAVTQVYDDALTPLGLSSGQFMLLLTVRLLGETSLLQLADAVWTDRSVLSRTVRPLEDRGLLTIITGRDRRTRRISLTPAGQRALREGYACWQEAQARMAELLGEAQLGSLLDTLDRSMQGIQPKFLMKRARRGRRSARHGIPVSAR
ncbi:MAG TPA: MarR family winged helix-turn-helix transcriptional regulator [Opitutaceae bacterium]|nr:MarR family winged helix-turn-helix transcriptional regulator [Opitutaceae bacterium]